MVFAGGVLARMASPLVEIRCPRLLPRAGVVHSGDGSRSVGLCAGGSGVLDPRRRCTGVCRLLFFLLWMGAAALIRSGGEAGVGGVRRVEAGLPSGLVRRRRQFQVGKGTGCVPGRCAFNGSSILSFGAGGYSGPQSHRARVLSPARVFKLAGSWSAGGDGGGTGFLVMLFVATSEASLFLCFRCLWISPYELGWNSCSLRILSVCVSVSFVCFPYQ